LSLPIPSVISFRRYGARFAAIPQAVRGMA
jgi:hypothetical protein